MQHTVSLSRKLVRIGAALLLVALASIGLTLWVTWQFEGGAAAVNEAGRMRMQAWRITSTAQTSPDDTQLKALVARFDDSLALLRNGDATRPLAVPWDAEVLGKFAAVESLWLLQRQQWLRQPAPPVAPSIQTTDAFVQAIDQLVLAIEKHLARLTAILNLFQLVMMAFAIGGAVLMLYTGYLYVINPLTRLRQGLAQVQSGHLATRIEVDTADEFGQVATGFNQMAGTLESLYQGLALQVEAKTRHIEAQRMRLEALYEVSAFLAQASSIEELAQGFSQRVQILMKADAATVRWSDDASERYLMLASSCFPQELLDEEHSLPVGACACGNLRPGARTRVIPIVSQGGTPVRRCARVGYQSVVTVPIRLQQRLLGGFNLFYRNEVSLSAQETELLDALASHLASAIEGLHAAALAREAAVAEERALLARELHDSIAQSLVFLKIQLQLLRRASDNAQPEQVNQALDELDAGLRESIGDVRELLLHFRVRTNTGDIEQALEETLTKFRHQSGLAAHLRAHGHGLPLAPDVQVQVLHVVQEALSNVRKHAQASWVELEVAKGPQWRLAVRDDGIGFDAAQCPGQSHVGLNIMRERAAVIGAQVELVSLPGRGTSATLTLPAHPVVRTGSNASQAEAAAVSGLTPLA